MGVNINLKPPVCFVCFLSSGPLINNYPSKHVLWSHMCENTPGYLPPLIVRVCLWPLPWKDQILLFVLQLGLHPRESLPDDRHGHRVLCDDQSQRLWVSSRSNDGRGRLRLPLSGAWPIALAEVTEEIIDDLIWILRGLDCVLPPNLQPLSAVGNINGVFVSGFCGILHLNQTRHHWQPVPRNL